MNLIYDLSHAITDQIPCSFSVTINSPIVHFEEGESQSVTSNISNLHSDTGTHINLPFSLVKQDSNTLLSVGEYPIDRFVGKTLILDFSQKIKTILPFFNQSGELKINPSDEDSFLLFLKEIEALEITQAELEKSIKDSGFQLSNFAGIIFYTGLGFFWQNRRFEAWQYLYFFTPFLSQDACQFMITNNLSFVGIEGFQLQHPMSNFSGDELPFILNLKCRQYWDEKLKNMNLLSNASLLLANGVIIYKNLKISSELINHEVYFSGVPLNLQIQGLSDNALVRPYAVLNL